MDKLGLKSKRAVLIVFYIALPLLLFGAVMYQNSNLGLFEGISKTKGLEGGEAQNNRASTFTASGSGAKNDSFDDFKNLSSQHMTDAKNESFSGLKNYSSEPATTTITSTIPNEKLLDGLLASGFDEKSCLSRYQSYLYRKASPHKPSAYLISKLRNYEDLHRKCGPRTEYYNRTMRRIIRDRHINVKTTCKYIIWTAANGLGNRIVSMSAAFLYAVLTDRVLLVEFWHDMTDLFCEPFLNSSWEVPKSFHSLGHHKKIETYESLLKNDRGNTSRESWPSILHLNLQHGSNDHDKLFHCDHSQALLHKIPALILRTDQYFVPSLFMIPSFKQELNKMFPEKDTVLHHLGHYLFHPSNEAWGLITRFYQAYLAKADEKIGIQVRVLSTEESRTRNLMKEVLDCTLKNKLLPELDTKKSVDSSLKNKTLKSVLVASLIPDYAEYLRTMYWMKPTVTGEIIGVYQPSHEGEQKSGDNKHNMKAWAEIYLLSLCDTLVTSSQSTFGYVAQSLGGLKPWILYKSLGEKDPPLCQRAFSMEPCFHFPPKYDCTAKTKLDIGSVFPSMRFCEDINTGLKLVDNLNSSQL
ncbi:Galactoside 2-alpha-L-fucosyltransferase [Quillaja saponaria]|uniref:Fucosyltransferase n=1 Tax=Quillaja saponaria TaxID=32244 RepID=A0AAD7P6V2_QUISA|nr:Galactoside 2-alpha-L-fucosyltransferase [Quillaja saponaria]